jgi:hypothetical protein
MTSRAEQFIMPAQKICVDVLISSLPLNSIQVLGIGNLAKRGAHSHGGERLERPGTNDLA